MSKIKIIHIMVSHNSMTRSQTEVWDDFVQLGVSRI